MDVREIRKIMAHLPKEIQDMILEGLFLGGMHIVDINKVTVVVKTNELSRLSKILEIIESVDGNVLTIVYVYNPHNAAKMLDVLSRVSEIAVVVDSREMLKEVIKTVKLVNKYRKRYDRLQFEITTSAKVKEIMENSNVITEKDNKSKNKEEMRSYTVRDQS